MKRQHALDQQTNDNERLDDEGVIVVFPVTANGTLGDRQLVDATGQARSASPWPATATC